MRNSREQILTILHETDCWLNPSNIAYNTDLSRGYIQRECYDLWEREMLYRDAEDSRPFYSIRERGRLALELDTLEIEYSYHGHHPDEQWKIIVEPAGKSLNEFGNEYHDHHEISWGEHGGDGGTFNVAQDLLRHAVGPEAANEYAFEFYQDVTKHLKTDFELTETHIRAWVANKDKQSTAQADHPAPQEQEQPEDLSESLAAIEAELKTK